jgi:hypothetical protein
MALEEEIPQQVTAKAEELAGIEPPALAKERHAALSQEIEENRYRYFVLDAPTISDGEYDALTGRLPAGQSMRSAANRASDRESVCIGWYGLRDGLKAGCPVADSRNLLVSGLPRLSSV